MKRLNIRFVEMENMVTKVSAMPEPADMEFKIGTAGNGQLMESIYTVVSRHQMLRGKFYTQVPEGWDPSQGLYMQFQMKKMDLVDLFNGISSYQSDCVLEEDGAGYRIRVGSSVSVPVPVVQEAEGLSGMAPISPMYSFCMDSKKFLSMSKKAACLVKKQDSCGMDNVLFRIRPEERSLEMYSSDGISICWVQDSFKTTKDLLEEAAAASNVPAEMLEERRAALESVEAEAKALEARFYTEENKKGSIGVPAHSLHVMEGIVATSEQFSLSTDGKMLCVETSDRRALLQFALAAVTPYMLLSVIPRMEANYGKGCRLELDRKEFAPAVTVIRKVLEMKKKTGREEAVRVLVDADGNLILRAGEKTSDGEVTIRPVAVENAQELQSAFSLDRMIAVTALADQGNLLVSFHPGQDISVVKQGSLEEASPSFMGAFLPVVQKAKAPVEPEAEE